MGRVWSTLCLKKARRARIDFFGPKFNIFREQRKDGEQGGHRCAILDFSQELVTQITVQMLILFIAEQASAVLFMIALAPPL